MLVCEGLNAVPGDLVILSVTFAILSLVLAVTTFIDLSFPKR